MKLLVKKGKTSLIVEVFINDSSVTTGAGLTGLVFDSASLTAYYNRNGAAGAATQITLVTATKGTWVSGGFVAVDGTNMPGLYELHLPDAVLATGAGSVVVMLKGATNMAPVLLEIQLVDFDPENAASLGLTNLDAAVSSRLADADYTAPDNAGIAANGVAIAAVQAVVDANATAITGIATNVTAVKAKTDQLTFTVALHVDATASIDPALISEAVWGAAVRTLTTSAAEQIAALESGTLALLRGDEWNQDFAGLGSIVDRQKLWITARADKDKTDASSLFQITEAGGLIVLNGAAVPPPTPAPGDPETSWGSITVTDEDAGDITVNLLALATALLAEQTVFYDVQWMDADDNIHTLISGKIQVVGDVTRAVS